MRLTLLHVALMMIVLLGASQQVVAAEFSYAVCAEKVASNPQEALEMAEKSLQERPVTASYHCRAMALFALARYEQAAGALGQLSTQLEDSNRVLWGSVARQEARSWGLAGDNARAIVTLTQALRSIAEPSHADTALARILAELLQERAALYAKGGRELLALQDLDHALSAALNHPPLEAALLMDRAELLLQLGETAQARQDVAAAQQLQPNHPRAAALAARLQ
jgi:tetratricopeptide (TPR) repeat protein